VSLIPNGANVDLFQFQPEGRLQLREEWGLADKFIAMYAGIHGVAQGLETLVEAARLLQADPGIHFVLVGDGPKKGEITALARQYALPNLTLLPEQPRLSMPAILSAADVALIPLRNVELFKGALPSKMFDAWACQRPVVLSVDGEARQALETCQGGVFVPPEDAHGMATAIKELCADPAARAEMGDRGRKFTVAYYSRQALAEQLVSLLEGLNIPVGI
jgi:glycosyltransferase involved in cell wall biosynthesis